MKKLVVGFNKYTLPDFLERVTNIETELTDSDYYTDPVPAPHPSIASVLAKIADYRTKHGLAEDGDSGKIGARNAARVELTDLLVRLAPYLEAVAAGDVEKLEATGYELTKDRTPTPPGALPAPQNVKMKQGVLSGSLYVGSKAVKGAGAYETQLGTNPNDEASFTLKQTTSGCRKVEFTGLTPGALYYARMRAIGPTGPGAWSSVENLRVI